VVWASVPNWVKHTPRSGVGTRAQPRKFDSTATSFSGAAIWNFQPGYALTFSAARSQRLPHTQELYARGVHLATNTYECGLWSDAGCGAAKARLKRESSQNLELRLAKTEGDLTFSLGAFANDIDNYIYARTLDTFDHDAFKLIQYSQNDAKFRGFEAEITWHVNDALALTAFGDSVNAKFDDKSGHLPRIPAGRYGARVNLSAGDFDGEVEFYHSERQSKIAAFETATAGYDMLNLTVNYRLPDARTRLFVRGANLLDEKVWNHASFLADVIPLPGRNVTFGISHDF